jgi:hypothetical protein
VDIQILHWGDPGLSYRTLQPRSDYRHVQRMLAELKPELNKFPVETYTMPPLAQPEYEEQPVADTYARPSTARSSRTNDAPDSGAPLTPFY